MKKVQFDPSTMEVESFVTSPVDVEPVWQAAVTKVINTEPCGPTEPAYCPATGPCTNMQTCICPGPDTALTCYETCDVGVVTSGSECVFED